MSSSIAVDAKGNIYRVPDDVLAKHCTKLAKPYGTKKKKGQAGGPQMDDWTGCYGWINGTDVWLDCPPDPDEKKKEHSKPSAEKKKKPSAARKKEK